MLLTVTSAITLSGIMLTVCILAHAVDNRVGRFVAAASFEIAFVCGLFALWQVANGLTRGHTSAGLARGRAVYHFERVIHLPTERSAQQLIIHHHHVVRAANYYYDTAHLTLMVVFLVWLWLIHRDRYPFIRNMIVVFTGMSLLIQMIAVAPPRLIGGTGLIDTAAAYHQSVYQTAAANIADQYAAMPSIHVGWAMLISFAIVTVNKSRWRWIGLIYGPTTFFVVVATANHYWLDGVAAIGLLVVAWFAAKGIERLQQRHPLRASGTQVVAPPAQIQQGAFS